MPEGIEFRRHSLLRLCRSRSGNVATMFAVAAIPTMVAIGAGIDRWRQPQASATR
jgi:Flp pilus assembly protein TadG